MKSKRCERNFRRPVGLSEPWTASATTSTSVRLSQSSSGSGKSVDSTAWHGAVSDHVHRPCRQATLIDASLSYLGLGVQEPTPAWELMLRGPAEEYAESAPWVAIYSGLAITLAVFGFSLFGDAVRDALDPNSDQQQSKGRMK